MQISGIIVVCLLKETHPISSLSRSTQNCFLICICTLILGILQDGHETNIDFVDKEISVESLNFEVLGSIYFGRRAFKGNSEHAGKLSDINIWDYALSKEEMTLWTTCQSSEFFGNIIDWSSSPKWDIKNMIKVETTLASICQGLDVGPVLVPETMNVWSSLHLCRQIRSKMYLIDGKGKKDLAMQFIAKYEPKCSK